MKKIICTFFALAMSINIANASDFQPFGDVSYTNKNVTILHKPGFDVVYDNDAKIPVFASYVLTPEKTTGCVARSNRFRDDPEISKEHQSHPGNYTKSGYDLGHNVNAADMAWSQESSTASFLMSNMSPQLPKFNRGIFKKLETEIRDYTFESGDKVLIYVGNIWSENSVKISNGVIVPDSMFKIVVDLDKNKMSAYILPNLETDTDLKDYLVKIEDIENETGIKFHIPDNITYDLDLVVKSNRQQTKNEVCSAVNK